MKFLYKAGIHLYHLAIKIAVFFNAKASLFVRGRKGWKQKLAAKIDTNARYLWFHCASLGEFEQGRPLIEEVRKQFPQYRIVLTFFSPSGYEIRKNYEQADIIMYLPIDTRRNAKTFIKMIQPEKAFFIKYEYWHFYFDELKKRGIPLYMVSAIFRDNQQFFKKNLWGQWYRQMLKKVTHFFVQDEKSARLLQSLGIQNYTVSGDTRFDRVAAIAENVGEIPVVDKFKNENLLLVAGSTWQPDEELLATFINEQSNLKTIVAPHEVTPANINRLELLFNDSVRFSRLDENSAAGHRVIIIDSIGMLSSLYRYGEIAYIGGGFGVGIHNILEAATFGLPIIFGPNYRKFKEAVDLNNLGGAFPVNDKASMEKVFKALLFDHNTRKSASEKCKSFVAKNVGSTQIILKKVFNL